MKANQYQKVDLDLLSVANLYPLIPPKPQLTTKPLETPVSFFCYITFPIPKSFSKKLVEDCLNGFVKPAKRPDWDNVAKAIADSIVGIVYVDDCQIVNAHVAKRYGTVGMVEVMVREDV